MTQGLIGGVLWGVLAAGFGLVVVSQVANPPSRASLAAKVPATPVVVAAEPALTDAPQAIATAKVPVPDVPAKPEATAVATAPQTPAALRAANQPDVAAADAGPDPIAVDRPATVELPRVADAAPEPDEPAKPSILKKPAPLPPTPSLASKGQPPVSAPLPGTAPDAPAVPDVAAGPAGPAVPAVMAASGAPSATPPRVATAAPVAVAVLPQALEQPFLLSEAAPPAALPRPADVAGAGPSPAGPSQPAQASAPTLVVTEAPRAAVLPALGDGERDALAPVATARAGFQPGLIGPVAAPSAAEAAPATGLLPPPPPLTPEELAILAEAGAITTDPALPEIIVLTEADEPAIPSILKKPAPLAPTPSLAAKGQVPATESLPRIVPDPAPEAKPEPVVTLLDDAPPINRFARPFDNAAGKPLFAVVLIDTGDPRIDRVALAAMPFAVTFALDPTAPESALAASIYRAAGQEVVMLASGIPEGATAADVEVSFGAHDAALPEAVAVLDLEVGGFQGDRPLATLVVPVLAGQGRGLLSWDRGLNAASQVARREGLRSGVIFRRLDGEAESVAQIRRYLDRAAFKAAQDGRVIVAGETRPNTVAALLEWAVEGRASSVALAPLTAALRVE